MPLNAYLGGHIHHPQNAKGGIDQNPHEVFYRVLGLELKRAVDGGPRVPQIAKEIAHPFAKKGRCDLLISARHGSEHIAIHGVIEGEHAAVERLQRVRGNGGRNRLGLLGCAYSWGRRLGFRGVFEWVIGKDRPHASP